MKPVIGITTYEESKNAFNKVSSNYINAIFSAGGIPINIPIIYDEKDYEAYINIIDGIIFTGGHDVSPLLYGENPLKEIDLISSIRDKYELGLLKNAYDKKLPILGICRGCQLMNVALGGSLYQDISTQVPNSLGHNPKSMSSDELYHSINIKEGSKLYSIFKTDTIFVNSFHHQAIKKLGNNLKISAVSEDRIIEAIEATDDRFMIGVQFHPEGLVRRHDEFLKLFYEFILATIK